MYGSISKKQDRLRVFPDVFLKLRKSRSSPASLSLT